MKQVTVQTLLRDTLFNLLKTKDNQENQRALYLLMYALLHHIFLFKVLKGVRNPCYNSQCRHHDKNYLWEARYDQYVSNRPNYFNRTEIEASKSRWLKESVPWRSQAEWMLRVEFAKRMSSLYALDEMMKTVYDKIAAIGELDDTIFIMASDNGYNMGIWFIQYKANYNRSSHANAQDVSLR